MDVSEKSPVLVFKGLIPSLAYDLRKAYSGNRKKDTTQAGEDQITIYGVEQVWPTIILQIALLRTSLAFIDSSKYDQAHVYHLEGFLENAIKVAFPGEAETILYAYHRLIGIQEREIMNTLGSRVAFFLDQDADTRRAKLAEVLGSLAPMWDSVRSMPSIRVPEGALVPAHFEPYTWDSLSQMSEDQLKL